MTTFIAIFIASLLLFLSSLTYPLKHVYGIRYYSVTLVVLSLIAIVAIQWGKY